MTMLSWIIHESGLVMTLSDKDVPDSSPVRLYTDSLVLLFPGLQSFDKPRGLYIQATSKGTGPGITIRGGRIVSVVDLGVKLFVDLSDQYGNHTLD